MTTKLVLSKSMVILAIAFALGGSALSTNASAAGGVLEVGRITTDAGHRVDRVRQGHERGYACQPQARSGYEWDPWGHWGGYYGPHLTQGQPNSPALSAQAPATQYPSSLNYGG